MQSHFEKEEQLFIPVLGILRPYVEGTLKPEAENQAIEVANMFKQEYKNMLNEHKQIVVALDNVSKTASMENRQDALPFIEQVTLCNERGTSNLSSYYSNRRLLQLRK
jgi:hypothetical protein